MPSTLDESGCPIYSILMDDSSLNVRVQCDVKKQFENINYVKQKLFETDYIVRQYKKKILLDKSGRFERFNNSPDAFNEACTFNVAPSSEMNNNYDITPQAVGLTSTEKAELEGRLASTEIKIQEMKSHINQLQMLVTEYETQIEALKIENQLQKCNAKEYNNLINDICLFRDIVLGKKKMHTRHKKLLKKYDKYKSTSTIDDVTECSVDDLNIFNHSLPSVKVTKKSSKNKTNQGKGLLCDTSTVNKTIDKGGKLMVQVNGRQDSDSVNEIISEDSGFSSFGLNSPDYYPTNSPCSTASLAQKEKKNYVDIATSPITVQEEVEVINTHNDSSDITKNIQDGCATCSHLSSNIQKEKIYADIATSPITVQENLIEIINVNKDRSENDHCFDSQDNLILDNHTSGTSQKLKHNVDENNGYNTVQDNQTEINNEVSKIEDYFNDMDEIVSDHALSDRLQEEINANKVDGANTVQENLVDIISGNQNCKPLANSEIEIYFNSQDNIRDSPLSVRSVKQKVNKDEVNEPNAAQENVTEIIRDDKDNVSLCVSDIIEGCLFSQDSFETDIPLCNERIQKRFSDIATSPITVQGNLVEMATSPISFLDCIPNDLQDKISTKDTRSTDNDTEKTKTIGINTTYIRQREIATSPIKFDNIISGDQRTTVLNSLSSERECLELNNSRKLNDSCFDCEIETILRTMRLDCDLITPIPKSPAKLQNPETSTCYRCQDMAKLRKENENLQLTLQDIAKSMFNITWLMKSRGVLVNNNLHNDHQAHTDFVMNDSTLPDTSNINIQALNSRTENIPNDLHSSVVIENKPTKATAVINSFEFGKKENHVNNSQVLNNRIDNVPEDFSGNQATLGAPILKSVEICDQLDYLSNDHVLSRSKGIVLDEFCSEEVNQDQTIPNIDLLKSCEVEKELYSENNMEQSCNNHVNEESISKSPIKNTQKVKKAIKLTKLEKWKKKLLPKSKIRRDLTPPIRKDRKKQQLLKKKLVEHSSKSTLDNKAAYKKAVEVMAELRDKEKNKTTTKPSIVKALEKNNECKQEVFIVLSKCDDNIPKHAHGGHSENHVKLNNDATVIDDTGVQKATHVIVDKTPTSPSITTRSRSKQLSSELFNSPKVDNKHDEFDDLLQECENPATSPIRRGRKRCASDRIESTPKRMLQGSTVAELGITKTVNCNPEVIISPHKDCKSIVDRRMSSRLSCSQKNLSVTTKDSVKCSNLKEIVSYNDLDVFTGTKLPETNKQQTQIADRTVHPKDRILCRMLEKYSRCSVKFHATKIPEVKTNMVAQKLEAGIAKIISVPQNEAKNAMNNFVDDIQNLDRKLFVTGLMKYLTEPARKDELFNKVSAPPAPSMTKAEQVLLYILKQLQVCWAPVNIVETIMKSIEFALFQLNHTPEFGTVESLSHFYAILCRYFGVKSRLRLFILDAMYCIQFKSVALIKQCLEVWMHILPLAHMGIAKSPLVMCLIYLLHFFKCEDKYNRVQEIRDILSRKYFYHVTEWTESKMLEMFKSALLDIRDIPVEQKMLRMALIILAKRRGPHWSQKNIIKDMIQPLIEKEGVSDKVKEFCVSLLGPLLKPYPNDMRVHCEVVINQLIEMLDHNVKPSMQEAIFTSLLYMRRHNPSRVNQALFAWSPRRVAPELEQLLRDYVREKPARVWKHILSKIPLM